MAKYIANVVKSGAYVGNPIVISLNTACIFISRTETVDLAKWEVEKYEVISGNTRKSMSSSIIRGTIGGALFGTPGMVAGSLSAKNKTIYTIAVEFKNGRKSIIEIDDKIYNKFMEKMF